MPDPDPKGLSQPRETAPDPLTMVAAANGHGSVIDDADVVSMTVTTSPRRSTFLQQARWDARRPSSRACPFARWPIHRDTVRRYIDVETPRCGGRRQPYRHRHLIRSPNRQVTFLLNGFEADGHPATTDKGYESDRLLAFVRDQGAEAVIPPKSNRREPWEYDRELYRQRNLIERAFNKLKQWRRIATRYDPRSLYFLSALH